MEIDPATVRRRRIAWRAIVRRPRWWLAQPWFVVGVIALVGLVGITAVREYAMDRQSAATFNPNAVPFPITSGDQGCQNFADYWTDLSETGVPADVISTISTCRQAADGSWFLPTGPNDPRLPAGEAMTQAERAQSSSLRAEILAQITAFEGAMPGTLVNSLNSIRTGDQRAVIERIRRGANVEPMRTTYKRFAQAFLISPDVQALAEYAGWIMERRAGALATLVSACKSNPDNAYLFPACDTIGDALNIGFPPFIWDLFNPLTFNDYLAHEVRTSAIPPTGTPAANIGG